MSGRGYEEPPHSQGPASWRVTGSGTRVVLHESQKDTSAGPKADVKARLVSYALQANITKRTLYRLAAMPEAKIVIISIEAPPPSCCSQGEMLFPSPST